MREGRMIFWKLASGQVLTMLLAVHCGGKPLTIPFGAFAWSWSATGPWNEMDTLPGNWKDGEQATAK